MDLVSIYEMEMEWVVDQHLMSEKVCCASAEMVDAE